MNITKTQNLSNSLNYKTNTIKNGDKKNYFKDYLKNALDNVNELQIKSDEYKKMLVTGEIDDFHEPMIAMEKANVSLQLTLGIRNKVIDGYREIMRMQL